MWGVHRKNTDRPEAEEMNETKGIVFRDDRLTEVCGMVYGPDHEFHPGKICMEEGRMITLKESREF